MLKKVVVTGEEACVGLLIKLADSCEISRKHLSEIGRAHV